MQNIRLTQTNNGPTAPAQKRITASVTVGLFGQAMPIAAVRLNDQHGIGDSKINRAIGNRVLMLNANAGLGKATQEGDFKATGTRPHSPAQFAGATPGTGTKTTHKRMSNHPNGPTDFAGHRVRPALVVVSLGSGQTSGQRNTASRRTNLLACLYRAGCAIKRRAADDADDLYMRAVVVIGWSSPLATTRRIAAYLRAMANLGCWSGLKRLATVGACADNRHCLVPIQLGRATGVDSAAWLSNALNYTIGGKL